MDEEEMQAGVLVYTNDVDVKQTKDVCGRVLHEVVEVTDYEYRSSGCAIIAEASSRQAGERVSSLWEKS